MPPIEETDKPVLSDRHLEQIITGKKSRPNKAIFLLAAVILIIIFGFGSVIVNALGKIKTANIGGGSPLLSLNNLNLNSLKGEGDGRINIVMIGIGGAKHPGGQLSDTLIVASIDPKNHEAAFLSIPRDLYVKYPKPLIGEGKINNVHAYGEQNKVTGGGPAAVKQEVSNLLDLPIHYFIRVDFDGFRQLVDSLGGITVNVPKDLYDPLFPASNMVDYEPFSVKAGIQNFDGKTALKYARSRETTSDFDRAKRQQQILVAVREKATATKIVTNPAKIVEIINIIGTHIKTDLTIKEIDRLVKIGQDIPKDKIVSRVLDNGPGGPLVSQSTEQGYFLMMRDPTGQEIKNIAHNIFKDPYISDEAATIEIRNASSSSGLAATLATDLTGFGYKVVKVEKSDQVLTKTQLIDNANSTKPVTGNYLAKRLNVSITKKTIDSKSDFIILLGDDYKATNTK